MGHLEMVNQVLKRTTVSVSFMECKKIFDLVEVENSPGRLVQNISGDVMDTLKKFILV